MNPITSLGITNKAVRDMVRQAVDLGCRAERTNGGHVRILGPDGGIYIMGTTAPGARNTLHLRSALKRMGVEVRR